MIFIIHVTHVNTILIGSNDSLHLHAYRTVNVDKIAVEYFIFICAKINQTKQALRNSCKLLRFRLSLNFWTLLNCLMSWMLVEGFHFYG